MPLDSFVDAVAKVFVNLQWYLQCTIALRISALGATAHWIVSVEPYSSKSSWCFDVSVFCYMWTFALRYLIIALDGFAKSLFQ